LASTSGQAPFPDVKRALRSIRIVVLVALIFAIIGTILELVVLFFGLTLLLIFSVFRDVAGEALDAEMEFIRFVWLVFLVIDVQVIRRTRKMYSAAKNGNIVALKSLNSLGWAIAALIFGGVVAAGVLLLALIFGGGGVVAAGVLLLALIFGGGGVVDGVLPLIVAGVLLLIARRRINDLPSPQV